MFPKDRQQIRIADVKDGTSNTIMLVEADDEHAVVWTKPDDLEIDLSRPHLGLAVRPPGACLALMTDGSIVFFRNTVDTNVLAALFTRSGGEPVLLPETDRIALRFPRSSRRPFGIPSDAIRNLGLGEFVSKGIGNQVGLHICDSDPLFAFNLPRFLGMTLGTFQGGRGFLQNEEGVLIGLLVSSLSAPVYVSVPVSDATIVDEFLDRLDDFLAVVSRESRFEDAFFSIDHDFYHLPLRGESSARGFALQFGPMKWRFFWARIGDGLYVASKAFVLEDLLALQTREADPAKGTQGPLAHGMVRMRPRNWNQVLTSYRLGWAENHRDACLNNLGPLSSLSRALSVNSANQPQAELEEELRDLSARLYDTHFFCPDGGRYVLSSDTRHVTCSVHGSAAAPRQLAAPSESSELGRLLKRFSDMTLALTFLEDGLHAVVTIDQE